MKKILFIFLLFSFSIAAHPSITPASQVIVGDIGVKDPVNPYSYLSSMKVREVEKLLGRKMKFKEKLSFKAFQWSIKKGIYPGKPSEKSKKGNTALILGIVAIASLFIPYLNIASIPCAILAIIFGNQAKKANPDDGQAKAGVILGWVTLGLIILATIIVVAWLSSGGFWFG